MVRFVQFSEFRATTVETHKTYKRQKLVWVDIYFQTIEKHFFRCKCGIIHRNLLSTTPTTPIFSVPLSHFPGYVFIVKYFRTFWAIDPK